MNCIRRICRSLTQRVGVLLADGATAPAGQLAAAATRLEHAPPTARLRYGDDPVPDADAGRAASRGRQRRRKDLFTMTVPGVLPHTIQLCIHCRHNPAGFWVSRDSDQTVRRPWCLSCCQDLDPACHYIKPFDS